MITPNEHLPNLAKKLGLPDLYFKREDKHPFLSHKGRSIPKMIDHYIKLGKTKFVISSSGNSALASALYIKESNEGRTEKITLKIFVGPNINSDKENKIRECLNENISLEKVEKPKQKMIELGQNGFQIIRQSNDNTALVGLKELTDEILEIPNLGAVFFPVSSGTLLQGVSENLSENVKIFAIQTEKCHKIAEEFDQNFKDGNSLADAIVDKIAFRKQKIIELVKKHNGGGFVVADDLIEKAMQMFRDETSEVLSPNGIVAFAGLLKALDADFKFDKAIVCVVGGR